MRTGARLSDDGVRLFHSQLDSQAYSDIVRDSDEAFQNSESRDELIKFLAGVHSKLGPSRGFTRTNIMVNAGTYGTFIKATYQSTFDQGNAIEALTWRRTGAGLKLVRYDFNSNAFLTTMTPSRQRLTRSLAAWIVAWPTVSWRNITVFINYLGGL